MEFREFLKNSQHIAKWHAVKDKRDPYKLCIVLSNDLCDLDSCISTLAVAYYHHHYRHRHPRLSHFLPVINMRRRDFVTKTEVVSWLATFNLSAKLDLVFRDEIVPYLMMTSNIILVNHHVSIFYRNVREVYDYRPYRSAVARLPPYCSYYMGSRNCCATLIFERYMKVGFMCPIIFKLLRGAIILHNDNFKNYYGEENDHDREICNRIELICGLGEDRNEVYAKLTTEMFNLNSLTLSQILRGNFKLLCANNGKQVVQAAVCSFTMPVLKFIAYHNAEMTLREFARDNGCNFVLLVSNQLPVSGGLRVHELGVICLSDLNNPLEQHFFHQITTFMHLSQSMGLRVYPEDNFMHGAFFYAEADLTTDQILQFFSSFFNMWVRKNQMQHRSSESKNVRLFEMQFM